jgi:hypothetical protein
MTGFFGTDLGPETSSPIAEEEIRPTVSSSAETADFKGITFMALLKRYSSSVLDGRSNLLLPLHR